MSLLFDASDHTYWSGGVQKPSVSTLLRWGGRVPEDVYRGPRALNGLARGRRVHRASCAICAGLDAEAGLILLPGEEGYGEAWRKFRRAAQPVWSAVETPLVHEQHGYAGTPDRCGMLCGRIVKVGSVVLDVKTGAPQPWHALQLAGYDLLLAQTMPIARTRIGVYLNPDGRYSVKVYERKSDYDVFLSLVQDWSAAHAAQASDNEWTADDVDFSVA